MENNIVTKGKDYSYARVSHVDMNLDRQRDAFAATKIKFTAAYEEKKSGKNFERDEYKALIKAIGEGDCVWIKSIDRLGRNYEEILEEWRFITKEKNADINVIDMPLLDTRRNKDLLGTFIADLVLQVMCFFSEQERTAIKTRQREGIASAQARGIRFGRPERELTDKQKNIISLYYDKWKNKEITAKFFMGKLEMKSNTFYRTIEFYENMYLNTK